MALAPKILWIFDVCVDVHSMRSGIFYLHTSREVQHLVFGEQLTCVQHKPRMQWRKGTVNTQHFRCFLNLEDVRIVRTVGTCVVCNHESCAPGDNLCVRETVIIKDDLRGVCPVQACKIRRNVRIFVLKVVTNIGHYLAFQFWCEIDWHK